MRISVLSSLAFLGVAAAAPLSATQADGCANASEQATMNECADKAYKASDAELNKLYTEIKSRLSDDADTTKLLVSAQRAWIAFRDAECTFSSSRSAEGSVYPMIVSQCRDGLTQNRIKDFKTYLTCEEGDMSCPVPPAG